MMFHNFIFQFNNYSEQKKKYSYYFKLTSLRIQYGRFFMSLDGNFFYPLPQHGIRMNRSGKVRSLELVQFAGFHGNNAGDSLGVGHDQSYLAKVSAVLQMTDFLAGGSVDSDCAASYEVHAVPGLIGFDYQIVGEKDFGLEQGHDTSEQ